MHNPTCPRLIRLSPKTSISNLIATTAFLKYALARKFITLKIRMTNDDSHKMTIVNGISVAVSTHSIFHARNFVAVSSRALFEPKLRKDTSYFGYIRFTCQVKLTRLKLKQCNVGRGRYVQKYRTFKFQHLSSSLPFK